MNSLNENIKSFVFDIKINVKLNKLVKGLQIGSGCGQNG